MKNPAAVALGKLGGKAGTGQAKARTSEQARAAVNARWAKRKPKRVARRPNDTLCRPAGGAGGAQNELSK